MTKPTMEQRVRELERRVLELGQASNEWRLRTEAAEAILFTLTASVVSNLRRPGASPARMADFFMQHVEAFAGFDPDSLGSAERWAVIRAFGDKLVEATRNLPGDFGEEVR